MKRTLVFSWFAAGLLLAAPTQASVLETWTQFSIQFTNLGRAEAADTGVGVSTVTTTTGGRLETLTLGFAPELNLKTVLPVTDPIVSNGGIVEVRLSSVKGRPDLQGGVLDNIPAAIAGTGPLMANTIPTTGSVRICLVSTGCTGPALPLDVGGMSGTRLIGIGVGGILTIGGSGTIMISVLGAPYTVDTVTAFNRSAAKGIETFMEFGFGHGPASLTSTIGLSSGVVQFVSASHTRAVGIPGNSDIQGNFSRWLIHFVPEPGLLLLFGAGAIAVAGLGRARGRS